ncbi:CHAT domain-containing protein [Actinosynnema sp. NPDC020468]|uniref:CHAT domain-containing protein n=1 Tax=Actinosynnema sp. NPDC020468 TaxID=3154488 RepID=UPI0033D09DD9
MIDTAALRAEAAREVAALDRDPESVDPARAGMLGDDLALVLDPGTDCFATDLDLVLRLVEHASTRALDHPLLPDWVLCLAIGWRWRADLTGLTADWDLAVRRGEDAAAFPFEDPEDVDTALRELALTHAGRVLARQAGGAPESELLSVVDTGLRALAALAPRANDPVTRAHVRMWAAHLHSQRWDLAGDPADLDGAVGAARDAVPALPEDSPESAELWELIAHVGRIGRDIGVVPLDEAVDAAAHAATATATADSELTARHLLLTDLLEARPDAATPEVADRIIASLLVVAERGDADAEVFLRLGYQFFDRGELREDPEDLAAAVEWLGRHLDATAEPESWLAQGTIAHAHELLWRITGRPAHADTAVEWATKALADDVPDIGVVHELHYRRLTTVFMEDARPDLASYVDNHPVSEWLVDAARVAATRSDDTSAADTGALLAVVVGASWVMLIPAAPEVVCGRDKETLDLISNVVRGLRRVEEAFSPTDECTVLTGVLVELLNNIALTFSGESVLNLDRACAVLADDRFAHLHDGIRRALGVLSASIGMRGGDLGAFDVADSLMRADAPEHHAVRLWGELIRCHHSGSGREGMLPPLRQLAELLAGAATPLIAIMRDTLGPLIAVIENPVSPSADPNATAGRPIIVVAATLAARARSAAARYDHVELRSVCRRLDDLAGPLVAGRAPDGVDSLRNYAYGELSRLLPHDGQVLKAALEGAEARFADARDQQDPLADVACTALAELVRRRGASGDLDRSRRLGLEALRLTGWRVLTQSRPDDALKVAAKAAAESDVAMAWCLHDHALDELVQVLDARRGLVLEAALTSRGVSDRLVRLGHVELAREWEANEGRDGSPIPGSTQHWGALRRKALRALGAESGARLTSPSTGQIRHALGLRGADALVYLVPRTVHSIGMAVVVPVRGPVRVLVLPELRLGPGTAPSRYAAAYKAWYEAADSDGPEHAAWRAELRSVCDWAWKAAVEPVLDAVRPHDGTPGLVLVPFGELGMVPWHAAFRVVDGVDRHLVRDATVSYTPSARLFCEVAERVRVTGGVPVLVGNPARNLPVGLVEALAVGEAFYPDGVVLGGVGTPPRPWRPAPGGAGSPEEVIAALRAPLPVLHLACHATADMTDPLASGVQLGVAGVPTPLTARELLELSPTRSLPSGLVVLAGCETNLTGGTYDEAFSLSTVFLAIGARGVVGSSWRVPAGRTTAHLMYLLHHHLARGVAPAEALRRAQLWMLDPDRAYPDSMPDRLRDLPAAPGHDHVDLACWAGFTQQGH